MERKNTFSGELAYIFGGIRGEAELILRIWGAKEKYFQEAEEFFFQEFGEINALFSGITGAQTSLGGGGSHKFFHTSAQMGVSCIKCVLQNF